MNKPYKQMIIIDGEEYRYQETFDSITDLHYEIKDNPCYAYRKITYFDGEMAPDLPRTVGMWLRGERHEPVYDLVLYATNQGCYQHHAIANQVKRGD